MHTSLIPFRTSHIKTKVKKNHSIEQIIVPCPHLSYTFRKELHRKRNNTIPPRHTRARSILSVKQASAGSWIALPFCNKVPQVNYVHIRRSLPFCNTNLILYLWSPSTQKICSVRFVSVTELAHNQFGTTGR